MFGAAEYNGARGTYTHIARSWFYEFVLLLRLISNEIDSTKFNINQYSNHIFDFILLNFHLFSSWILLNTIRL